MNKSIVSALVVISLLAGGAVLSSFVSDKIEVPTIVKKALSEKYSDAEDVEWEMENDTDYEAEFELDKREMSAVFSADGTWLQTETEVDKSDLPEAVKAAIKKSFPAYKTEETEMLERLNMPLAYEVELETKDDVEIEVIFAADGTVLEQSKEETEDED